MTSQTEQSWLNFKSLELNKIYLVKEYQIKEDFDVLLTLQDKEANLIENVIFSDECLQKILSESEEHQTYFKIVNLFTKESLVYEDFFIWFTSSFDECPEDNKEMMENIDELRLRLIQK